MEDRETVNIGPHASKASPEVLPAGRGEAPGSGRRSRAKITIVCLVLLVGIVIVYLTPIRAWFRLENAGRVRESLAGMGGWTYPVCILTIATLIAAGTPRLLFCLLGGALLGFWPALVVNEIGTLLAYYGVFLFVRWGGRDYVLEKWPKTQRWAETIGQRGTLGVIMARLVPIHGTLINLCFGLSRVKHRAFVVGTAIGILAEAVPVILIGAGLAKASLKDSIRQIAIALVAFVAVWFGCKWLAKRKSRG
jgi:uncharacterized membrane protein YdjX (TVP38/TMEM64 family)